MKPKDTANQPNSTVKRFVAGGTSALSKMSIMFMGAVMVFAMINLRSERELISSLSKISNGEIVKLHIPSGLEPETVRRLSLNLGGGDCLWTPPLQEVPNEIDFWKTAVVGFPSGDKRLVFIQMESLTGWPAKDEWDFQHLGDSNHPFIKVNYPHHEGIWGWGTNADQVVLVVKNIRKSLVEYHDILWDIGYAKTWEDARVNMDKIYGERPPLADFREWRDLRVLDEIHWYGWFIDYWMEGGLMRDVFTHKITTPTHWNMLMRPTEYTREELDYDLVVGADTEVTPSYDPHCTAGEITSGCQPVAVVSAEKLLDYSNGPAETTAIANILMGHDKMSSHVIEQEAWDCIWNELIVIITRDSTEYTEDDYNFSAGMIEAMIEELDRLIDKYSSSQWTGNDNADRLVQLFTEHRAELMTELHEVNSGARHLKEDDFLGPTERENLGITISGSTTGGKPNLDYFKAVERERFLIKLAQAQDELAKMMPQKSASEEIHFVPTSLE